VKNKIVERGMLCASTEKCKFVEPGKGS